MDKDKSSIQVKNANTDLSGIFSEDLKKALTQSDNMQSDMGDPTKFTLMNDALVASVNDNRKKHFTEYTDFDEVLQMNDILIHATLLPLVFGNTKGLDEKYAKKRLNKIDEIKAIFIQHANDHMSNMMSFKMHTKLALIHGLKNDNSVIQTDKEIKKMFGGR